MQNKKTENELKLIVVFLIGFVTGGLAFTKGINFLLSVETSKMAENKASGSTSVDGFLPMFYIQLKNKKIVSVKVEYKVSFADSVIAFVDIQRNVQQLSMNVAKAYTDEQVFERNLLFHLNDKIPVMTGSKKFVVSRLVVLPTDFDEMPGN